MKDKTKPISIKEIETLDLIEDDKQGQRFETVLRQVISVPREEILRREVAAKKRKEQKTS